MKKTLQILIFFIFSTKLFSQLDTEHWFAAMYDGQSNTDAYQYLYLSTNDNTPFTVNIYSHNILIDQAIISKGSPQYVFIPRQYIIVNGNNTGNLLTPVDMGLFVKGERRFFANLRIGITNHAEIITSKGAAALGKDFYTAVAPLQINGFTSNAGNQGFQASVIATEDNTTVTINKFNKPLVFTNGTVSGGALTVTLDKGQSYIIDGRGIVSGNRDGFIGTRIVSDKPVALTNGNFNGQYVPDAGQNDGSDILMDQSVSVENLGNEFGIINGMGIISGTGDDITNNGMERAIVVATKNNTQVYINNAATPIKILNEGEYYFVPDTYYSKKSADHYNLYIRTTENVYVYQVLGGVSGSIATGSMNFIPPLGCYLPRKIEEIGFVDQLEPGGSALNVKLNIITESGGKVKVNGNYLDPSLGYGPFALEGNASWETYSVPNVKGNITVESDKAVNAGLAGGDGNAVGYAGYFAGFSAIPFIVKKEGICIPDVILELPEGYDYYQWFVRNEVTGLPEAIPGANSHLYRPLKPGVYSAEVQRSVCLKVTSPDFTLLNCPTISTFDASSCNTSVSINPVLSNSSQQTDWNSVVITEQPTKGIINLDRVKKIFEYNPNPGADGIDIFEYNFCGIAGLPDCEAVTVSIYINIVANDARIIACNLDGTEGSFDLTSASISTDPTVTQKIYYKFQADADNDTGQNLISNSDLTNYRSSEGFVYVRLKNANCSKTVKIELAFFPLPQLLKDTYEICDNKLENKIDVELDKLTGTFLKDHNYFKVVNYYNNSNATGTSLPNKWSYSENTVIYMKVESPDGCAPVIFPINFKIGSKVAVNSISQTEEICDDDFDSQKLVKNLDDFKLLFSEENGVTAKFFVNKTDAQNNAVNDIKEIQVNSQQLLFVRLFKNGVCDRLVELTLKIKIPGKSTVLANKAICPEKVTTLDAGDGFLKYDWYNANNPTKSLSQERTLENVGLGDYFVILTAFNRCEFTQNVKIIPVELPEISEILINNNTVTVTAVKGNAPYLYSLDGIHYQASNVFNNVSSGYHKAYVISKDDCLPFITDFTIIEIYNVLTPNNDGYNDVLDLSLLETKVDVKFTIHDRNGMRVFEGDRKNKFIWDGTQNGRPMPTSSYWYLLEWKDFSYSSPVKYAGWTLLKNRN